MKFIQDKPGLNHRTDDAALIYFHATTDVPPTHLNCVGMGFALCAHSGETFNVELAPFELIGIGVFGPARPSGSTHAQWTGDSHKYGVYKHKHSLLILESHGGGEQGYFERHSHATDLFDTLCETLPPERIWDLCYLIAKTQNQAYHKGRYEMASLFMDGRLKRRRRNNAYRLEILPGTGEAQPSTLKRL